MATGKEAEAGIANTMPMQADDAQTTKGPFAGQMRFWDGFYGEMSVLPRTSHILTFLPRCYSTLLTTSGDGEKKTIKYCEKIQNFVDDAF